MKLFFSLALFAAFLLCPAACADGVREGLALAGREALPALFPFFVASGLLVRSGLAERLGRAAARPLARLYGLPPEAAPAVILGLTGGYPVGTATVAELLQQGALSREAAARVNAFCNCASPGFCIGLVGLGVFGSARTGAVLYGIHALSALLTGLVAKEAVVSTMSVLYGAGGDSAVLCGLLGSVFTPLTGYSFLVFTLLYMPCMSAFATIKREMGGWRWAFGAAAFQTGLAYLAALAVYQIGSLLL